MKVKGSDIMVAVMVVGIVLLIIVPPSTAMMDTLLILNIAISMLVILMSLYIKETLEFSTFPTLILLLTLYRLTLNVASTRLILGNAGQAGNVIDMFASFVMGGNFVVGFIIFLIIVIIQFMVITKGSERVAEVAARFTLDAMPGKQMAIDADLNTGIINEAEAKKRREGIQREADFYGAMDGASKFIKGDAIIGIIITVINFVGGIIIGVLGLGGKVMPFEQVLEVYALATVGGGLVTQIPALLVSTSAGIIVTRSASESSFGSELSSQLFAKPHALYILGGMLALLGFIPGMPTIPILLIAIGLPLLAYLTTNAKKKKEVQTEDDSAELAAQEKRKPENVTSLLQVYPIEMEFGYGIISLVDTMQGGDLLDRIVMIRRQCAMEMGIIVPVVRVRDNIQLGTNSYCIKIKGLEIANGDVMPDHFMALRPAGLEAKLDGIETTDPAFGLPAVWITESERERAELKGFTTIDSPSVIATHLMEVIKHHAHELMGRQQVQVLIDNLKTQQPALVDEVIPKLFSVGEVQKILANLLREGISIRDIASILEILGDYGTLTRDLELLTEYVRQNLKRAITQRFVPDNKARVITLDPQVEQTIASSIRQTERGSYAAVEPMQIQRILLSTKNAVENAIGSGGTPIFLTAPSVRRYFKQMTEQLNPDLVVLSYNELERDVEIFSDGVVSF